MTHDAPGDGTREQRPSLARRLLRWTVIAFVAYVVVGTVPSGCLLSRCRIGSPVRSTQAQMRQIEAAVSAFRALHGRLPATLGELVGPHGLLDAREVPRDAWGNPFHYAVLGPADHELISRGADGIPGGTAADADLPSAGTR